MQTTIRLNEETKAELDKLRQYKNESYDEVVRKIVYIVKMVDKDPKLSKNALEEIRKARERIDKGDFYTNDEAKKILGL